MTPERGRLLLGLARASIAEEFGGPQPRHPPGSPWLDQPGAVFVSLHKNGELRGCVGTLEARRTLFDEVLYTAKSAAFRDRRLVPLRESELPAVTIDITLLHPLEQIPSRDEEEAIAHLRPGSDGVVLESGARRAVFIPKMWQELPDPHEFLAHLKHKAGFSGWPGDLKVQRFTAEECSESDPKAQA